MFLARNYKIPTLEFMDLCSPAALWVTPSGRIGLPALRRWGLRKAQIVVMAVGMAFPSRLVPTTETVCNGAVGRLPRLPDSHLGIFHLDRIAVFLWRMGREQSVARRGAAKSSAAT